MSKELRELEDKFAGLEIQVKGSEFMKTESKKMLRVSARECVEICNEQVNKVLHEVEMELKSSDEFVYPSVYETINRLRNHE